MKTLHLYNILGAPTERTMLEVSQGLAAAGHNVSYAYETLDPKALAELSTATNVPRIVVEPTEAIDEQMEAIADEPPAVAGAFDLVHGHFGPRGLHASRYLVRGVPVVISCYGYDVSRLLHNPYEPDTSWQGRYRWLGERGARFVALSEAMRRALMQVDVPGDAVEVIPLGIDTRVWALGQVKPSPTVPHFLFVGRFVPKKGPVWAINALARLKAEGYNARLTLVGSGKRIVNWALRFQARELGVEREVEFVGNVPYGELADVMRQATALVMPSTTAPDGDAEGCPMVLMQSQAVGTPVITTTHSGNPEAVPPEGQRFVVPEQDTDALAGAMRAMIELGGADRAALIAAGRAWIEERFDLKRTVAAYDKLYREMTAGG